MRLWGILSLAAVLVGLPASASAAPDQIVIDPSTSSGKEYAIPLNEAVRSSGGTRSTPGGDASQPLFAPLFGPGISTASRSQPQGPSVGDRRSSAREAERGSRRTPSAGASGSELGDPVAAAAAGRAKGSSISTGVTFGIPVVALLAGTALLIFVTRRHRPHR
jgi:hypothetical protein